MAEIVQLRQRIKAIETIKKITHAMRLIAMSSHSRLKMKQDAFERYTMQLKKIFSHLTFLTPDWKELSPFAQDKTNNRTLSIIISGQKGLCGNFNSALFAYCSNHLDKTSDIIVVGKKASQFLVTLAHGPIVGSYDYYSAKTIFSVAHAIMENILAAKPTYSSVVIYGNMLQNFFTQRPATKVLIPFSPVVDTKEKDEGEGYIWEQPPKLILETLLLQYIETEIQQSLFQSLLAEQAARFISMDRSTRNAEKLLEESKLEYNKLRQAKITQELSELIATR